MSLTLTWQNLNTEPVSVRIYRGDAPLVTTSLPSPLVTLTAGETQYVDTTAVQGQWYYYLFETFTATDRVYSNNRRIQALTRRGPGSNSLVFGDEQLGYYGSLSGEEFILAQTLKDAVAAPGTVVTTGGNTWYKYVRNGKILFVPMSRITSTISWIQLYQAGLVYGVDSPGKGPVLPTVPVNQKKVVTIGNDRFLVRLATGFSDDPTQTPPTGSVLVPTETYPNEINDLMYPLARFIPVAQKLPNVSQNTVATLQTSGGFPVQELATTTTSINRGASNGEVATSLSARSSVTYNVTTSLGWWPVLELIEE